MHIHTQTHKDTNIFWVQICIGVVQWRRQQHIIAAVVIRKTTDVGGRSVLYFRDFKGIFGCQGNSDYFLCLFIYLFVCLLFSTAFYPSLQSFCFVLRDIRKKNVAIFCCFFLKPYILLLFHKLLILVFVVLLAVSTVVTKTSPKITVIIVIVNRTHRSVISAWFLV